MTESDLARKAARQERQLSAWLKLASDRVRRAVGDARAHAEKAVTATLRDTPDGRPTLRKATGGRSYAAAVGHLDDLLAALAGPSTASLDGLVRDAREQFYRAAWLEWLSLIPPELHAGPGIGPTRANVRLVRGYPLHGYDLRTELAGPFDRARRGLLAAVHRAGRQGTSSKVAAQLLAVWERQAVAAVAAAVKLALSDSQVFADRRAARDLIHPDHLDDTPVDAGV